MASSFPYLDLAIGISFIYLLMALVCSTVNEAIAGVINSRGKTLEKGILSLLHDPALKAKFYAHPLIQGLQDVNDRLPSYIASNKFALALMDTLTGPAAANDPDALRKGVASLENTAAKTALTAVLQNPQFKTDQERLEAWYEQSMNRVSGWYKRTSQIRVFMLAAGATLLMNADTLKMLDTLWNNPTRSALLIEDAKARLQKGRPDAQAQAASPSDNDVIAKEEKQLLGQVAGWQGDWYKDWPGHKTAGFWCWIWYLLKNRFGGWLITILAVSLGAPFWFDTLSRFMNVRSSGKPPDQSSVKASA
ncbi:MAG: hypothetical protein ABSC64_01015 [Candidatus Korobacteraceae bacterium]|jgi:hypothetical protein